MRINTELATTLDKKYGKGKWKLRHANYWATSNSAAKAAGVDPASTWAIGVTVGKTLQLPKKIYKSQEDIIYAETT